ncbi:hypothetical protein SAMN05428988_3555 [Chitinophaga sp. YR573]|nr:hypothetical protein SAMN05428988_3555 [Chitinophaga sp. YR573]
MQPTMETPFEIPYILGIDVRELLMLIKKTI